MINIICKELHVPEMRCNSPLEFHTIGVSLFDNILIFNVASIFEQIVVDRIFIKK